MGSPVCHLVLPRVPIRFIVEVKFRGISQAYSNSILSGHLLISDSTSVTGNDIASENVVGSLGTTNL